MAETFATYRPCQGGGDSIGVVFSVERPLRTTRASAPSAAAVQRVEDGRIVIEVVQGRHGRSLAGSLKDKTSRRPADESWESLRRAAWETADPDRRP